jgi:DNA helicase-2/ATP-dependent DNA helicase PcrA
MSAMPLCMPSFNDNLVNWNASSPLARDATQPSQPPWFPSSVDHVFYDPSPMRPSSLHSASRQPRRAPQAIESMKIMGSNKPALSHTLSRREPKIPQIAPVSPAIFDEDQPPDTITPTLRTPLVVSTPIAQSLQHMALVLQKTGVKQPQITPIFDENQPPDTIATPTPIAIPPQPAVPSALPKTGVKRRLGMGRITSGYSNKKFKPPA